MYCKLEFKSDKLPTVLIMGFGEFLKAILQVAF